MRIVRAKDRQEWLQLREGGIGSSEVATIVGLNPFETAYQLWRRKRGIDQPKEENTAMRRGHFCEDAVARWWQADTGREVIKASSGDIIMVDDTRDYLRVSPDRTYWVDGEGKRNGGNKGILECKTTNMAVDPEDLPKHWFCQLQYQLGVAGYTHGSLAWLGQRFQFGYADVDFVPDFYGWLVEQVERFHTDCILGGREPEPMNASDVVLKYSRHADGKTEEVSDDVFAAWQELKSLKANITDLTARKDELEDTIKMAFGDAEAISYGGNLLATWKAPKPSVKFDEKGFKAENSEMWSRYTSEVQGARRLLIK